MKILKRILLKIFTSIFILVFLISSHILIDEHKEAKESNKDTDVLKNYVMKENINKNKIIIDWNRLNIINEDIIAWIKIENTNINYPILKDNQQLYYLNHSYNKKSNRNGSIFTIEDNFLENKKNIIYGHNMNNKIMFSDLEKYMDKNFFDNHKNFHIYTPTKNFEATVFSCYSILENQEKENILNLNFDEEIEYYKRKSKFNVNNIGTIDKIVKLSTCSYLNSTTTPTNERYYIVAKIIEI